MKGNERETLHWGKGRPSLREGGGICLRNHSDKEKNGMSALREKALSSNIPGEGKESPCGVEGKEEIIAACCPEKEKREKLRLCLTFQEKRRLRAYLEKEIRSLLCGRGRLRTPEKKAKRKFRTEGKKDLGGI